MKTIIKFHKNVLHGSADQVNENAWRSNTLGKVSFISRSWLDDHPTAITDANFDNTFWLVNIVNELHFGQSKGCYLVEPITCVNTQPSKLTTGEFYCSFHNGIVIVYPDTEADKNFILPSDLKKKWTKTHPSIYSVVVNQYNEQVDFINEPKYIPTGSFATAKKNEAQKQQYLAVNKLGRSVSEALTLQGL